MPAADDSSPSQPQLTVVVCSLGAAPWDRCISSVLRSVDRAVSVGAVDHGEVVLVWQDERQPATDLGVRVVKIPPMGLSYARNRGLAEARADVVAFVDDDEVVDEGWASAVLAAFRREPRIAAVFGRIDPLDDDGIPYCRQTGETFRVIDRASAPPWTIGTGGNMAFRKEVLVRSGSFDLTFGAGAATLAGEDTEVIVRLLRSGEAVAFEPDAVVYHPTKSESERLGSRYPYGFGMGKVVRRHRDAVLAAKYALSGAQSLLRGVRENDARRRREATETMRGFLAGASRRSPWSPPPQILDRVPAAIAAGFETRRAEPLEIQYNARPHLLWRLSDAHVLHLYIDPAPSLERATAERETIRARSKTGGIPALLASEQTDDGLWLVEEWMDGVAATDLGDHWFEPAVEWLVDFAGPADVALGESSWMEHAEAYLRAAPAGPRRVLERSLRVVSELPAAHQHGDFEPKNILVENGHIHVIDWESAQLEGLRGLDLLFLLVSRYSDIGDTRVLVGLALGAPPPGQASRAFQALGIDAAALPHVCAVAAATWAYGEGLRFETPGVRAATRPYGAALRHVVAAIG